MFLNMIESSKNLNELNGINRLMNLDYKDKTGNVTQEQVQKITENYLASAKANNIDVNNVTVQSMLEIATARGFEITYDKNAFNNSNEGAKWTVDDNGNRKVFINPNVNNETSLQNLTVHELTHDLENTEDYKVLSDLVLDFAEKRGFKNSEAETDLRELYKNELAKYDTKEKQNAFINSELVANILGTQLGNQEFINHLTISNRQTANWLYNWVVDKLNKLNRLTGYKFEKLYWADVKNKFDKAFKADFNNYKGESKFAINPNFKDEYDNWDKIDRNGYFVFGRASEAMKSIGLIDNEIVMDKSKILKIKNKHPEMTDDIIKNIPEILENPTLILKSQSNSKQAQKRLVFFGEIVDAKNNPILVALELNPNENRNNINKIYKVASAYGKENLSIIQNWLNNEENVLYIDKKNNRTINWLSGLGLQLPVPLNVNSSIDNSISQNVEKVNYVNTDNKGRQLTQEQQEYFKDSKARNENGELEVVYHGTNKAGFTEFNRSVNYYTNNKAVAQSYTQSNEVVDTRKLESLFDAKSWLKGITEEAYIENNTVYDVDGEELIKYNNTEELLKNLKRDIQKEFGDVDAGGTYEGYVNITSPVTIDAKGELWSMIDINNISIDGIDNIEEFLKEYGSSVWMEKGKLRTSTADLVSAIYDAVEEGKLKADGVIIKNIYDEGGYGNISSPKELGTDYITFNSNQFKALDNRAPTNNPDIRYSKQSTGAFNEWLGKNTNNKETKVPIKKVVDNKGRQLTQEQQKFFKDSKVRDENGNLKEMYHGTPTGGFNIFNNQHEQRDVGFLGKGFYFTSDIEDAEEYSKNWDTYDYTEKSEVKKVYLNMKNPYIIPTDVTYSSDFIPM